MRDSFSLHEGRAGPNPIDPWFSRFEAKGDSRLSSGLDLGACTEAFVAPIAVRGQAAASKVVGDPTLFRHAFSYSLPDSKVSGTRLRSSEDHLLTAFLVSMYLSAPPQAGSGIGDLPHRMTVADTFLREGPRDSLIGNLMSEFYSMNDTRRGVFQEDVTSILAPYFPPGQSFAETQKIIRDENLGSLQRFKGKQDADAGTMYVTRFSLMLGMFSEVYVVLHFDFEGSSEEDMVVKKIRAFLRGNST